jgi:uncharacterized coiled-coil protein SlyX
MNQTVEFKQKDYVKQEPTKTQVKENITLSQYFDRIGTYQNLAQLELNKRIELQENNKKLVDLYSDLYDLEFTQEKEKVNIQNSKDEKKVIESSVNADSVDKTKIIKELEEKEAKSVDKIKDLKVKISDRHKMIEKRTLDVKYLAEDVKSLQRDFNQKFTEIINSKPFPEIITPLSSYFE